MQSLANIESLLVRYAAGETTKAENLQVEQWSAEEPGNQKQLDQIRQLFDWTAELPATASSPTNTQPTQDQLAWSQLQARLHHPRPAPIRRLLTKWITAAAAILLLCAVGIYLFFHHAHQPENGELAVLTCTAGSQTDTLPDGSIVTLTGPTTIHYTKGFMAPQRDLHLEGRAFFEVRHDPARPFVIRTSNLVVTDLGTSFMIDSRSTATTVKVVSGSVSVVAANGPPRNHSPQATRSLILRAGDSLHFNDGDTLPPAVKAAPAIPAVQAKASTVSTTAAPTIQPSSATQASTDTLPRRLKKNRQIAPTRIIILPRKTKTASRVAAARKANRATKATRATQSSTGDLSSDMVRQKHLAMDIIINLKQDGLANPVESYVLTADTMLVNNRPQPENIHQHYKNKFLPHPGAAFYYGPTAITGKGFIFTKDDLTQ